MKKAFKTKTHIDTTHDLLQAINSGLSKLSSPPTITSGLRELKEIMQMHITNSVKMNTLITILSEQNEHMTLYHKKEITKVYGLMGEVFTESLIPFFGKLISSFKTRWEDTSLHVALSDSFGVMIHHIFNKTEEIEAFRGLIESLLEVIKDSRQENQIGAAMCLFRALQKGPPLLPLLEYLVDELISLFRVPSIKCLGQLFEILISLIFAVDKKFEEHVGKFIPIIIENMDPKQEWFIKKLAMDTIHSLVTIIPGSLDEQNKEIASKLRIAKTDKSKHVRDAAHLAYLALLKLKNGAEQKSLYETSRRLEDTSKSILNIPINPKFIKAAPKKTIEIHTVVPIKQETEKNLTIEDCKEDEKLKVISRDESQDEETNQEENFQTASEATSSKIVKDEEIQEKVIKRKITEEDEELEYEKGIEEQKSKEIEEAESSEYNIQLTINKIAKVLFSHIQIATNETNREFE